MKKLTLPKNTLYAHLSLLISIIIWSASGPIIKLTLNYIPVGTFLFFRFLIVCIVLLPFLFVELRKHVLEKYDLVNIFIIGILSQSSLYILFVALKYTGAIDATIIGVMASIVAIWLGKVFYKEKISKKLTAGLLIAIFGTFIVVIEPLFIGEYTPESESKLFGNLMAIFYNIAFVIYLVFSKTIMGQKSIKLNRFLAIFKIKKSKNNISPTIITCLSFYVGLITTLPFAIYEFLVAKKHFNIVFTDPVGLIGLLYMSFIASILGYLTYQWGLKHAKLSDTAIYGYLGPVFTLPFAYILLDEFPNTLMLIGSFIILIGVIVAEARNN